MSRVCPPPVFAQVFILKVLKVLCFDTLSQVFILKVDSGLAGALAEFFGLRVLLEVIFPKNVGGKGVRWLAGYVMGYYTIWLAPVKRNFVPFWEFWEKHSGTGFRRSAEIQNPQPYKPRLRRPASRTLFVAFVG